MSRTVKRLASAKAEAPLGAVVRFCDRTLRPERFQDWDGAANGLQVGGELEVRRVAAAVDGTLTTIRMAIDSEADLLLVHHGLFWGGSHPWTGKRYELMRLLTSRPLAVYSSHLPLDAHPALGNNAQLLAVLKLGKARPFFFDRGQHLGLRVTTRISREALAARLQAALGVEPKLIATGPAICREIGVVTGGAGQQVELAAREGVDTFITGEGPHWSFAVAEECGVNVCYGGHYATETFGVKALAAAVSRRFDLPWVFLDHPTGL